MTTPNQQLFACQEGSDDLPESDYCSIYFLVKTTYTVTQAQAALPRLLKQAKTDLVTVTRRDEPVAFLVSRERMEAFVETLEIMADPAAIKQVQDYERGKMKFHPLPEE